MTYYHPEFLAKHTPEQIEAARALEFKGKQAQARLQARAAASERREREAQLRRKMCEVRVSRELMDGLDDLVAEAYPDVRSTRGLRARLVREVLRDALGMPLKHPDAHRRLVELRERRASDPGRKEVDCREHETGCAQWNRPRSEELRFRLSEGLEDMLKVAAAATEPESPTKKTCSRSRLVREILRNECEFPPKDGGETLRRLAEWRAKSHYRSPTAVSREDIERELALEARRCLREHDRELWKELTSPELTGEGCADHLVGRYTEVMAAQAMSLYDKAFERYRRHLPDAMAQQAAKDTVIEEDVLLPPLWTAVSPGDSVVGEPRDPNLFEELEAGTFQRLASNCDLYLALRLTPAFETGPGDEAVPLLDLFLLDIARRAEQVYWNTIERRKKPRGRVWPGGPTPEERALRAAKNSLGFRERWELGVELLRAVSPAEADPQPVVVESTLEDGERQVIVRGGSGAPAFFERPDEEDGARGPELPGNNRAKESAECTTQDPGARARAAAAFRVGLYD